MSTNDLMRLRYPHLAKVAQFEGLRDTAAKALINLDEKMHDIASMVTTSPLMYRPLAGWFLRTIDRLNPATRAALGALAGSGLGYGGGALARWIAPKIVSKNLPLYMAMAGAPIGALAPAVLDNIKRQYISDELKRSSPYYPPDPELRDLRRTYLDEIPPDIDYPDPYWVALGALAGGGLGYGGGALARWLAPNAVSKRLPLYMAAAGAPVGAAATGILDSTFGGPPPKRSLEEETREAVFQAIYNELLKGLDRPGKPGASDSGSAGVVGREILDNY